MNTPICDFVREYKERGGLRLHMPGHKGSGPLGCEALDITEIKGADELYRARGIIRESENNAASLFGANRTVYSTEGSSLCIRAMVDLALQYARTMGRKPLILAGRNAHRALISAAALLDAEVEWLYPASGSVVACEATPDMLENHLQSMEDTPAAVYVTSPDYLGSMLDIAGLADVCRAFRTLLLVDNAHGAYLKFLPKDLHPMTLGADLCCDSAHKTLPVLTGGAYLHLSHRAPAGMAEEAERAMALFASTSPSYLTLQSMDQFNAYLADGYPARLKDAAEKVQSMKEKLRGAGYEVVGQEPMKLTLSTKSYGYTGDEIHDLLRAQNMECEFSDADFLTAMLSVDGAEAETEALENALLSIKKRAPILDAPPLVSKPERVMSLRQAMLSPSREVPLSAAEGRILADAAMSCPPCIPIAISGERLDADVIRCLQYFGVTFCRIVDEV